MPVKFTRTLRRGSRGPDVEAAKRAVFRYLGEGGLRKLVTQPRAVRRTYGPFFARHVKDAQRKLGIKADGVFGPGTAAALDPYLDAYGRSLLAPDEDDGTRARVVARGMAYYRRRWRIRYSQSRPTQLRKPAATTVLDCSGLVAACMHFAAVLPSVDWRYTNTWIQIRFGRTVDLHDAEPGDVVFYGPHAGNPTHEALYLGDGQVLSMGHYPMGIYPVDYRSDRIAIRSLIGPGGRA